MIVSTAIQKMIEFYKGNRHDVNHFLKVWAMAKTIGELEGLDRHTQEVLDAICAKCPVGQLYEDAEAQDLRIRERSERALREHIEGVRHAEDTLTALLGGHEALAYLAALRDGQILQENECEHYAAQIAEAGAAWETVLEGVSFEDLSRLRHLLREVDEYTKGGGELFNGFQHETERIPAHRLEELHQLGTALLGEWPENDCTI